MNLGYLMRPILAVLFVLFVSPVLFAQGGFQKIIGGSNTDQVYSTIETPDGGYMISGITSSYGAGGGDHFLARLDHYGNTIWTKTYGGTSSEELYNVVYLLSDGNYILAGGTTSFGSNGRDAYILKIDDNGNIIWDTRYSVSSNENPRSVLELSNGDILIGGNSNQVISASDMLLIKLSPNGTPIFANNFGLTVNDHICGLKNLADGTIMAFGILSVLANHDFGLVNLDTNGTILWQKKYGGGSDDEIWDLEQTDDGGYIAVGTSASWGNGSYEGCLIKFDNIGNVVWSKSFGGSNEEILREIEILPSGNLLMYGTVKSYGNTNGDLILMKTDPNGNLLWAKTLGGTGIELLEQTDQTFNLTSDNMLLFGASSTSYGSGYQGVFIKSDTTGNMFCNNITSMITLYNAPITPVVTSVAFETTGTFSNPATIINTPPMSINNNCQCSPGFAGTVINTDSLTCSELVFSSNYSGGYTSLAWDFGDGNSSTDVEVQHAYTSPGTYNICLSITNQCGNDTTICKTVTIPYCPCINESLIVSQDSVCLGNSVTITTTNGNYDYVWSTGETTSSINLTPISDTTISVVTSFNNCSETYSQNIYVLQNDLSLIGDNTICEGELVTIIASGSENYLWSNSSINDTLSLVLNDTTTFSVIGSLDQNWCPDTLSFVVNVLNNYTYSISGDSSICVGDTVELTAVGASPLIWSNGQSSNSIFVSPNIDETYFVTSSDNNACSDTAFFNLSVIIPSSIIAEFNYATNNDCGNNYELFANYTGGYFDSLIWDLGNGILVDDSINLSYDYGNPGDYLVTLYVFESQCGNSDSFSQVISFGPPPFNEDIFMPNIFSPNDDQINDRYHPVYVVSTQQSVFDNLDYYEMKIFNRWGNLLFDSNEDGNFWDGRTDGKEAPEGVYYYLLKYKRSCLDNNINEMHGYLTLLRENN